MTFFSIDGMCRTISHRTSLLFVVLLAVSRTELTSNRDRSETEREGGFDVADIASSDLPKSVKQWHAQYGQDHFIYDRFFAHTRRRKGTFVELGAADGIDKSNTLAFEQLLGWRGVLIEASAELFQKLARHRPNCACVNECVSRTAGTYEFMNDGYNSKFRDHIGYAYGNASTTQHCRTLPQILDEYLGVRAHIDYLSLDTEGSELEILESLDFSRHSVDVISVEMQLMGEPVRRERIERLLRQNGFNFVERLVQDEIYVHRRGFADDPSCMHPSVYPIGMANNWADLRSLLLDFAKWMDSMPSSRWESMGYPINSSLAAALRAWQEPEAISWDDQCPAGVLTFALASLLIHNRKSSHQFDGIGISLELRQHTVFHPLDKLDDVFAEYDYSDAVLASEKAAEPFAVRLPLGRPWYESSFVDIIDSGWPFFRMLDAVAKMLLKTGHIHDIVTLDGLSQKLPVRVPFIPCELQRSSGSTVNIIVKPRKNFNVRLAHASIAELALDADSCSFLGIAAARFHAAHVEVQESIVRGTLPDTYTPLVNWTASCHHRQTLGVNPRRECSKMSNARCAAINYQNKALHSKCSRVHSAPGKALQLRRPLLAGSAAGAMVQEGERLLKEFIQRHGLYAAVRASGSLVLAPGVQASMDGGGSGDSQEGENMFAVLHSLQRLLGHGTSNA